MTTSNSVILVEMMSVAVYPVVTISMGQTEAVKTQFSQWKKRCDLLFDLKKDTISLIPSTRRGYVFIILNQLVK